MPYGISKKAGGDSAENVAEMERLIRKLQAQGKSKISAVLIAKSIVQGTVKRGKKA